MEKKVTFVLTSCNRPKLLEITLKSFFKYNTYPLAKVIIIDDSGIKNCIDNCLKYIPENIESKIIYNEKNLGHAKSIDIAYSFVNTEYIFHCEDDWEFYDSGFIEKSLKILESNPKILLVWLRKYFNFKIINNGHPIYKKIYDNLYRILKKKYKKIYNGFSFNPGLRRKKDYNIIAPFSNISNSGEIVENKVQDIYEKYNYIYAITLNKNGYVKHIGFTDTTKNKLYIC